MRLERINYSIETDGQKKRLVHLHLHAEVSMAEYERIDQIVCQYTQKGLVKRRDIWGVEPNSKFHEIRYQGYRYLLFGGWFWGGSRLIMDEETNLLTAHIFSCLPRNKSYDLLEAIKKELNPVFTGNCFKNFIRLKSELGKMSKKEQLKRDLQAAIEREEYEKAASLRDQISWLKE